MWLGADSRGQQPLISEAVRGEGAFLVDFDGRPVHAGRARARRPRAARRGRQGDHRAGCTRPAPTHMWLDARHLGAEFWEQPLPDDPRHLPRARRRPGHRADPGRPGLPLRLRRRRAPTCGAAPPCPGSTPAARSPAPACTAPTGWPPTRCSRAWSSPAGSPTCCPASCRPRPSRPPTTAHRRAGRPAIVRRELQEVMTDAGRRAALAPTASPRPRAALGRARRRRAPTTVDQRRLGDHQPAHRQHRPRRRPPRCARRPAARTGARTSPTATTRTGPATSTPRCADGELALGVRPARRPTRRRAVIA